jgi:hypothetical protein
MTPLMELLERLKTTPLDKIDPDTAAEVARRLVEPDEVPVARFGSAI